MKTTAKLDKKEVSGVISVDEAELKHHLSGIVRVTVEETLNSMLDAEADALCQARRYERLQIELTRVLVTTSVDCSLPLGQSR